MPYSSNLYLNKVTKNTSLTKKEKKNVKEMIANEIRAIKIKINYSISERTYFRIKNSDSTK